MLQACAECILSPCLPISHYRKVGGSKNKEVTSLQGCLHHRCLPGRGWYFKPGRAHIFTPVSLTVLPFGVVKTLETTQRTEANRQVPYLLLDKQVASTGRNWLKKKKRIKKEEDWVNRGFVDRGEGRGEDPWGRWEVARLSWLFLQRRSCSCWPGQVPGLAGLALLLLHLLSFLFCFPYPPIAHQPNCCAVMN